MSCLTGESRLSSKEDIEHALEQLQVQMDDVNNNLEAFLQRQCHLEAKLRGITKVLPNLQIVHSDAQQLAEMITFTSALAENVSAKVRQLDIARSRASECQQRVHDLLDLQLCAEGVKAALKAEDYEKAAAHVHRFLSMDPYLLQQTADDVAEDCTNFTNSVSLLRETASQLRAVVIQRFNEAVHSEDLASVERFFKLFPLLGLHKEGLEKFSLYLCSKLAETASKNLKTALAVQSSDRRANVMFADTLTLLFEGIARIVEIHQPLIETYYGPGRLMSAVIHIQRECDNQIQYILAEMNRRRNLERIVQQVGELLRTSSNRAGTASSGTVTERLEPRQLDAILGELAIAHARFSLYERFLRRRITSDLEVGVPDKDQLTARLAELETLLTSTETCRRMQELLSTYLLLERYFMLESVHKAVSLDTTEEGSLTSSMVDDIFFILRKCIRRAGSSGSLDGACAVINNAAALLEEELCGALRQRLRQGYPSGYMDLTQAYSSVLAGRLQTTDSEQQRTLFLAALNNADVGTEYIDTLVHQLSDEIPTSTSTERNKLESCLQGLSSTTSGMRAVLDYGIQQLRSSAVKPRIGPWVDAFLSVNHQLTEDEFIAYESDQPFVHTLVRNLHGLLENFKESLTPANYDTLVGVLTDEVTAHFEKAVLKSSFNRLGGLALDKEVRALASFLTNATSWSVRDKFARLTQMATVLNLEKISEIADYWGSSAGPLAWRLTPTEIRQIMALRVDFRSEDIKRLKL